jgi:hypothetical protein
VGELRASLIVRDESLRLPAVLDHHRRIGINRFIVIDNASKDGTVEFLLDQPDVHVFSTAAPFSEAANWRRALMDDFFRDCWSLHLDGDELFVYPGMEQVGLRRFCHLLEKEGAAGIFTVLVDMYAKEPLDRVEYQPGESLLERFPYFDASGYHLRFRGQKRRDRFAPPFQVSGGPRERLFFPHRANRLSRELASRLYDIRRLTPHPATTIPRIGSKINKLARRALPPYSPNSGKVPLLRWNPGLGIETHCFRALHQIEPPIPLSNCWAALLHFKYVPDMRAHTHKLLESTGASEYARYVDVLDDKEVFTLHGPESVRFRSTADLVAVGLMRTSPELDALLATQDQS